MTRECDSVFHPPDPKKVYNLLRSTGYCVHCHNEAVSLYSQFADRAGVRNLEYNHFMWSVMYDYTRVPAT